MVFVRACWWCEVAVARVSALERRWRRRIFGFMVVVIALVNLSVVD